MACALARNPNPEAETLRALYVALKAWLVEGTAPPPSAYPRLSDGTLVAANSAAMGYPTIPNSPAPDGVMNSLLDLDFGPLFRYNDGSGIITALEAVHIIHKLGLKPRRTLRVVFWTNEENGGAGMK